MPFQVLGIHWIRSAIANTAIFASLAAVAGYADQAHLARETVVLQPTGPPETHCGGVRRVRRALATGDRVPTTRNARHWRIFVSR